MAHQSDEQLQTEAELRDFKRTVLALRQELENAYIEADAQLHKSAIAAKAETAQLESTIVALRTELEEVRSERERAVQQAIAASHNEVQQLKATIAALRDKLEIAHIEKENEIGKAVNRSKDEISQLHSTISALREQVEGLGSPTWRRYRGRTKAGHRNDHHARRGLRTLRAVAHRADGRFLRSRVRRRCPGSPAHVVRPTGLPDRGPDHGLHVSEGIRGGIPRRGGVQVRSDDRNRMVACLATGLVRRRRRPV